MAHEASHASDDEPGDAPPPPLPRGAGLVLFRPNDGGDALRVRIEGETVWLTQAQMADLFQTTPQNVTMHLKSIYGDSELDEEATCKHFLQVRDEGSRQVQRAVKHYSLDAILAVGYRVRSHRGTQFRQWATSTLSEFLVKGFAMDDERLKAGRTLGGGASDYFDELLERIRAIRASERRFYQKITDIYATSVDYDRSAEVTQRFYATVQNKLHWAITGKTAAEIIESRADASKPNMGLTTWKNAPGGPIRKHDIGMAKNYLTAEEIDALNRVVTMYLDYAEDQARRQTPMHMADWITKLDAFLQFNERNILTHAGKVTAAFAHQHAEHEFAVHEDARRLREASKPVSDFDQAVEEVKRLGAGPVPGKKTPKKASKQADKKAGKKKSPGSG